MLVKLSHGLGKLPLIDIVHNPFKYISFNFQYFSFLHLVVLNLLWFSLIMPYGFLSSYGKTNNTLNTIAI